MILSWTDARRPVPRLWIRSAEVRGTSLGEWKHNNNRILRWTSVPGVYGYVLLSHLGNIAMGIGTTTVGLLPIADIHIYIMCIRRCMQVYMKIYKYSRTSMARTSLGP